MEVRNVLEVVHHKARSARVELDFQTDGEIKWRGNQTRFGQVVTNLVANGIDAYEGVRRRKRRKVEVKLESNGREVLLKVEDFGWGMDEACQKRVFEPFFSTKPAAKGTGIGLHLTREIVEGSFGGSINFSSVKGEGTVFEVRIPLNNYTN
jgi:C4-dicarboxylate-specific signal transduction histidine kinase